METQDLINQLSLNEPTEINTKISLQILKNTVDLDNRLSKAFECYQKLEEKFLDLEKRLSKLESKERDITFDAQSNDKNGERQTKIGSLEDRVKHLEERKSDNEDATNDVSPFSKAEMNELRHDNNFLCQWRIDNDIFMSGFPFKPDIVELSMALADVYSFSLEEISYKYSFSYIHPKTEVTYHYAVIGFRRREIKSKILSEVSSKGPLFLSSIIGESASNVDPQIQISNRLTVSNLRIQRELLKLKNEGLIQKIIYKNCQLYVVKNTDLIPKSVKVFDDIKLLKENLQKIVPVIDSAQSSFNRRKFQPQITNYFNQH